MAKIILGFAGMPGAGKGTAANYIKEKYGASMFRFSTVLSDIIKRLSLPVNRENLIKLSEILRHGFGEDILAHVVESDALSDSSDVVVIDGVRRINDLSGLEPLSQFKLVAIDAPPEIRYRRLINRGERAGEKDMTWEQFQAEEKAPTEVTIQPVMERAAYKINNSGDLDALFAQLDKMMAELRAQPRV
ncbi:MAG: AAA family ATPase [Patescibacteria group bacterium]|nr:AAA family ATPase [Patescibacteria group bacterium]